EHPLRRVLLHGCLSRRSHDAGPDDGVLALEAGPPGGHRPPAVPRPGKTDFRVLGVLGVPDVQPAAGDLVWEPAGRDQLCLLSLVGRMAPDRSPGTADGVPGAVLGIDL